MARTEWFRRRPAVAGLAAAALVVVVALGAVASTHLPGAGATARPTTAATAAGKSGAPAMASAQAGTTQIRWFIGLGKTSPAMLAAIRSFVATYNATNTDGIELVLEIAPGPGDPDFYTAYDVLRREIAAGNAPDLVGPYVIADGNRLEGLWTDLTSRLKPVLARGEYDPAILALLHSEWGDYDSGLTISGQTGVPYTVDPGFIFYNKALFAKAGLPPLPSREGELYMGQGWDWNELARVAAGLTLDSSGRTPSQAGFDPDAITQFGFDFPVGDVRYLGSTFGRGSFVGDDQMTAVMPPAWADAFSWYRQAMWTEHIAPTAAYEGGALLGRDPIASGHVAMAVSRVSSVDTYNSLGKVPWQDWGIAVMPSWKRHTTAPVGVTTFSIPAGSRHPDEAFKAMLAIEADASLLAADGGMPARLNLQLQWSTVKGLARRADPNAQDFATMGGEAAALVWAQIDAADPSPEGNMPALTQSSNDLADFLVALRAKPDLDLSKALSALQYTLQMDWTTAGGPLARL